MRLFVAVELTEAVRKALASLQAALRPRCDGVRWIPAEQLHLTVKFIGEARDHEVPGIGDALREVAGRAAPFEMALSGTGCFPPRGPARIVWAGVREETGTLVECANAVNEALAVLGVPLEDKRFSPHITVGRVREDRSGGRLRTTVESATLAAIGQNVNALTLMSSVLEREGPIYTPVATLSLGPRTERTA